MKNKIILFIMAVPLVLILVMFSLTKYVSLKTDVSVAGIRFINEEYTVLDLADTNMIILNAEVYPKNATNQDISYSWEKVKESDNVSCLIEQDSATFDGLGEIRITARSVDGNYKTSIRVKTISSKILDIKVTSNKDDSLLHSSGIYNLDIGENIIFSITTIPENLQYDSVRFMSNNEKVLSINSVTGSSLAKSNGQAVVTTKVKSGDNEFTKQTTINVKPISEDKVALINGQENSAVKIVTSSVTFSAIVNLNKFTSISGIEDFSFVYDTALIVNFDKSYEIHDNVLEYTVLCTLKEDYYGKIVINLNYLNTTISTLTINKNEYISAEDCEIINLKEYITKSPLETFSTGNFAVSHIIEDSNYYFRAKSNNSQILEVNNLSQDTMFYRARQSGKVTITIECYYNSKILFSFGKDIEVLEAYTSFRFLESENYKWHNSGFWTLGNKIVNNNQIEDNLYEFKIYSESTKVNQELIEITSSNENIAYMQNGKLKIVEDGEVTLTLKNKNCDKINDKLQENLKIYCINGVNVYNYSDLMLATDLGQQVAIQNDIMLGTKLINKTSSATNLVDGITEAKAQEILNSEVKQIYTTADWTYYKNNNKERPQINYCVEFKNNVYGNGHTLNAEYITNLTDITNKPLSFAKFKGPLDMVALNNVASVKAQDNIVFLIRNSNISINNIELKGCDNVDDLTKLNYIGTTCEVMGNNVTLNGCYIQNGRNVLRVFGDYENSDKQITVNINKCVLRSAREFILKMGTNKHILGDISTATTLAQKFNKASPNLAGFMYRNDANINNADFMQNYVKTIVNLTSSMLSESGIFAIGIETKFAGPCLAGESYNSWNLKDYGWYDIAGTSYPSILNLIGDVRIYDWKKVANVDSSTLIETVGTDSFGLSFDFQKIIKNASEQEKYKTLTTIYNNEQYVHGGIALYGGGKNYSIVNKTDYTGATLDQHLIDFSILNDTRKQNILEMASGKQPFRFMLYSNENFSVQKQINDFASGEAYEYMNH